jgi:hypothetical protein
MDDLPFTYLSGSYSIGLSDVAMLVSQKLFGKTVCCADTDGFQLSPLDLGQATTHVTSHTLFLNLSDPSESN